VWSADAATDAYIRTVSATSIGDPLAPEYRDRLTAASLTSEAIDAYNAKRYADALALYRAALEQPGGDQLRVLNGIYLAHAKLKQPTEATGAFARLVDFSLEQGRLAVKFLFKPGGTEFGPSREITADYPMWLSQLADRASQRSLCLDVVGHASPTGPEPKNLWLSTIRAEHIQTQLIAAKSDMATRLQFRGVGSREPIIGTGRDNASDALDRRVEFRVRQTCT
jgi:outer membrane protein OmpA-like peptidoglycan-associated protein